MFGPPSFRGPKVVCVGRDYPDGGIVGPHCHARAQLIYATAGVMEIRAAGSLWLVPPQRALWVGAGIDHAMRARGAVSLRTLYIADRAVPAALPDVPTSLAVTPLVRALILRAVERAEEADADGRQGRLLDVLLDEIAVLPRCPLGLSMPTDPRLRRACEAVLAGPGERRGMAALAQIAGASPRTLARLAERDLGVPFSVWRQQARILAALPILVGGGSVAEAAFSLGYDSPSAFASMFRRMIGAAPATYRPRNADPAEP
ncbi:helix-turn-helix transcriptional regulator [Methylobacterium sp. J-048]|uniref:AraC family transcriptional regulator n=1 Tax=Methylobacterium sp. J-048 TaxID=2836635 RepID=UPI001FB8EF34|nr:helix-turn-helix transcriptional regulator [Methylobacterium sp. J-048]MCJ2057900.1 helix-turn-helix transcriptional regulator [Methylobacterium sp. J-048]